MLATSLRRSSTSPLLAMSNDSSASLRESSACVIRTSSRRSANGSSEPPFCVVTCHERARSLRGLDVPVCVPTVQSVDWLLPVCVPGLRKAAVSHLGHQASVLRGHVRHELALPTDAFSSARGIQVTCAREGGSKEITRVSQGGGRKQKGGGSMDQTLRSAYVSTGHGIARPL
eukprot:1076155-Rhodomonas_salina.1